MINAAWPLPSPTMNPDKSWPGQWAGLGKIVVQTQFVGAEWICIPIADLVPGDL